MTSFCNRKRDGSRDEVAVLQRRTFIIERVGQLRTWLNIHDQRWATLNERDFGAVRIKVLCNIVSAIARTDDNNIFFLPGLGVTVLAGVQDRSREIARRWNIRKVRDTANARG